MTSTYAESFQNANTKIQWPRDDISIKIIDFKNRKKTLSQREFAKQAGVPRTTFQNWYNRMDKIDADPALVSFFESPAGVNFLHILIQALHFEFTKVGCSSIRNICNFLKLTRLSCFVAASYGTHQKISDQMDTMIGRFGDMEEARLSLLMPEKRITLCEDETFHPQVCLVAINPDSNYIILEKYANDRSGATWNQTVIGALANLPVKVIQSTSDEAKGLIHHVTKGLNGHHSPDLFHVMYEISRGTGAPLFAKIRKAEKDHANCEKAVHNALKSKKEYENLEKRPVGRPLDFDKRVLCCREKEQEAKAALDQARENREVVTKARKQISKAYHPYDPFTGKKQDSSVVGIQLKDSFDQIRKATDLLSDRCKERIDKAWRVTEKMTATLIFYFCMIESLVSDMDLPDDKRELMHSQLIPGFYLQKVSRKEKDPEQKELIRQKSQTLLSVLQDRTGPFSESDEGEINRMVRTAKECAGFFQRSSSCVEGRNAQLSIHHHGMHRLSDRKLKGLTVIHNFYLKRPDGTTAAERFFENKPINMFEWLVEKMPLPARPRRNRIKMAS
ncbi:DUF6399 domain-containing protein [Desulfobacula phenolica]|uniref:Uncharacterized protein n=1 Tax=Desulfobacula phenolica TaxID=90732 RepID=A0A1H2J9L4_9BACT|nr:DUF6399 domain-containing protein [Desulfobacula phenolica]SDU53069.1 hypothetical protein SAMN04487931_11173 [Desulfobacula phenolica]